MNFILFNFFVIGEVLFSFTRSEYVQKYCLFFFCIQTETKDNNIITLVLSQFYLQIPKSQICLEGSVQPPLS